MLNPERFVVRPETIFGFKKLKKQSLRRKELQEQKETLELLNEFDAFNVLFSLVD